MRLYNKIFIILFPIFTLFMVWSCYYGMERSNKNDPKSGDYNPRPTVIVTNIKNNSEINSGFLIGTASDNSMVSSVEVKIDNGNWEIASGTTNWKYQLPSGSNTWKGNSKHSVYVRSKDIAGSYSTELQLILRKGVNKDINGDGYPDLCVCAWFNTAVGGAHKVYIYHGGTEMLSTPSATITGPEGTPSTSSLFAQSAALGDISGDGYADLVIIDGAYNNGSNQERVYIFYSSGTNGISSVDISDTGNADEKIVITQNAKQGFDSAVAIGDVNGDGYADVAASYSSSSAELDYIFIFHSEDQGGGVYKTGATSHTDANRAIAIDVVGSFSFGNSLAIGDIDGDGYEDLVAGAMHYDDNATTNSRGRVYIFYGSSTGLPATPTENVDGANDYDYFGRSVELGDVNGDGYYDLVVGADGFNGTGTDIGKIFVYKSGNSSRQLLSSTPTTIEGVADGRNFGETVSLADLNGDGYDDLIVGGSGNQTGALNNDKGWVYIYHSSGSTGISTTLISTLTGENDDDDFGAKIGNGDFNGDGYFDIVAAALQYPSGGYYGRVYIFNSSSNGITSMDADEADVKYVGGAAGYELGNWIVK